MKRTVQGLNKKCAFGCIYCFTHENYQSNGQTEIDERTIKETELIQPFCDYDVFACEQCEWKNEITKYAKYGKIVSFATKAVISEEKAKALSEINEVLKLKGAFIHVGVSITTLRLIDELEPRASSYSDRVTSLLNLSKYDVPCSVIIRPLLPILSFEEIEKIVDDTSLICENYILGPLYLNSAITEYLQNKGVVIKKQKHNVNWLNGQPEKYILDSEICHKLEKKFVEYCKTKGKDVFYSNDSAVESIRRTMMKQDILKLKSLLNNCYGDLKVRSTAMLIDEKENKYFGVSITSQVKESGMTSISNAICNAVSEGAREFSNLYVYIESTDKDSIKELLNDNETNRLLKEFHLMKLKVIYSDDVIEEMYLE